MKINIQILASSEPPTRERSCKAPSLDDKVTYALGLIEADAPSKKEAIKFLQDVYHHLQDQHPYTVYHSDMMARLESIFSTYGITY